MSSRLTALLAFFAIAHGGCDASGPPDGVVSVVVAPTGTVRLTAATYTLRVSNESGRLQWSRTIEATAYDDGGLPRITVEGRCDADDDLDGNGVTSGHIELAIDVVGARAPLDAIVNPAPSANPVRQPFSCRYGEKTTIDLYPSFFRRDDHIRVDPWDTFPADALFCSAKLDCSYATADGPDEPILLLKDQTGARARTLVIGFACTFGAEADPHLYMDDLEIDCGDAGRTVLTSGAPSGLPLGPAPPLVFEQATYRGVEAITSSYGHVDIIKLYWNLAIGIADGALPTDAVCTLRLRAAGSTHALEGDLLRRDDGWGVIRWEAPLNTPPGDALTCGRNTLWDPSGVVFVDEEPYQAPFTWAYP